MNKEQCLLTLTKLCVQACLFSLFLFLFAIPDIERFNAKEVIVVKLSRKTNGMKAPSITITGKPYPGSAWKISGSKLDKLCETYSDNKTQQCIEDNTIDQSDVIKDVLVGDKSSTKEVLKENKANSSISHLKSLTTDLRKTGFGISYTFDESLKISMEVRITLCLSFNKSYYIWLHDKDFFFLNSVPPISGQSCKKSLVKKMINCAAVLVGIQYILSFLHPFTLFASLL